MLGFLAGLRGKKTAVVPAFPQQIGRASVERDKGLAAKPRPVECDYAIGKVATCLQHYEACFNGRTIKNDLSCAEQFLDDRHAFRPPELVDTVQHPKSLAERHQRYDHALRIRNLVAGDKCLLYIVFDDNPDKDVCINRQAHRRPAQASEIASCISSIET